MTAEICRDLKKRPGLQSETLPCCVTQFNPDFVVSQVTGSDPDPAARDVHHRSSASLQSAVWSLSGTFPSDA